MTKKGLLLVNLGSPDSAEVGAVRRYLNQFLMDKYVIQLPWLLRRLIVSLLVLPRRPKASAAAYQSVWTAAGSPLLVLSDQLRKAVAAKLEMPVALAMRYGTPSIAAGLQSLAAQGVIEVVFLPLYPHHADSTVTTSIVEAERVITKSHPNMHLTVIPPFYDAPDYITVLVASAAPYLATPHDHLVFSYHGLPESHLKACGTVGEHALGAENCCAGSAPPQTNCYYHQVMRTTDLFVAQAGIAATDYSVAFQSRLGRAKWLGPNTEAQLEVLAAQGAKKVLVICPAFVTDCLETLEEIAIRGQEVFQAAGGEELTLIPCLNTHSDWVSAVVHWVNKPIAEDSLPH